MPLSIDVLTASLAITTTFAAFATRSLMKTKSKLADANVDRLRLQRTLRARSAPPPATELFTPIAFARSCFSRRNGTPRQGNALVPRARCEITLDASLPRASLEGLGEYSHAWVVYVFHANTNLAGTRNGGKAKGKVAVPRLDGARVGVLATRTPHRPVPIGLSVGSVVSVDVARGKIVLGGVDLVDGTPVLDIKPYVPFCDSIPGARAPDWVGLEAVGKAEPLKISRVDVAASATAPMSSSFARSVANKLYADVEEFTDFVKEVLSYDIRSIRERNAPMEKRKFETYRVVLCDVEIEYTLSDDRVVEIIGAKAVPREVWDDLERAKTEKESAWT